MESCITKQNNCLFAFRSAFCQSFRRHAPNTLTHPHHEEKLELQAAEGASNPKAIIIFYKAYQCKLWGGFSE